MNAAKLIGPAVTSHSRATRISVRATYSSVLRLESSNKATLSVRSITSVPSRRKEDVRFQTPSVEVWRLILDRQRNNSSERRSFTHFASRVFVPGFLSQSICRYTTVSKSRDERMYVCARACVWCVSVYIALLFAYAVGEAPDLDFQDRKSVV